MRVELMLAGLLCLVTAQIASAEDVPPAWITEGPYVNERSLFLELPMEVLATKLFVSVELGGKPRRFVFDTGSPSMVSAELAAELGLEIIDTRQGRDAHGAILETKIAQTDLTLDGTTFHKVPVFIADFPQTAQCLFDGVLGSEVLPLCAWQIDVPGAMLRCTSDVSRLNAMDPESQQTLYDFGYPHTPFLDIQLADQANSKAMFDTGSSDYLMLSPMDRDGAARNDAIAKTVAGTGSLGGSLGGAAPNAVQQRVTLKALGIGQLNVGPVTAPVRALAPSLLGASLLDHYVITLDSKNNTAYFDAYRDEPLLRQTFGFGLSFDQSVTVSLVWEDSPAANAGLVVGDRVITVNGEPITTSCDDMKRTMQLMAGAEQLAIEWQGSRGTTTRANLTSQ